MDQGNVIHCLVRDGEWNCPPPLLTAFFSNVWEATLERERALAVLKGHQDGIRKLLVQAGALLDTAEPVRSDGLEHLRWQTVRALREYQLFKHTEIFDPLARSTIPERATLAAEMKARCVAVGDEYGGHTREWTMSKAGDDWNSYRRMSQMMVVRISDHLQREAADAGVLLRGVERTRQA